MHLSLDVARMISQHMKSQWSLRHLNHHLYESNLFACEDTSLSVSYRVKAIVSCPKLCQGIRILKVNGLVELLPVEFLSLMPRLHTIHMSKLIPDFTTLIRLKYIFLATSMTTFHDLSPLAHPESQVIGIYFDYVFNNQESMLICPSLVIPTVEETSIDLRRGRLVSGKVCRRLFLHGMHPGSQLPSVVKETLDVVSIATDHSQLLLRDFACSEMYLSSTYTFQALAGISMDNHLNLRKLVIQHHSIDRLQGTPNLQTLMLYSCRLNHVVVLGLIFDTVQVLVLDDVLSHGPLTNLANLRVLKYTSSHVTSCIIANNPRLERIDTNHSTTITKIAANPKLLQVTCDRFPHRIQSCDVPIKSARFF